MLICVIIGYSRLNQCVHYEAWTIIFTCVSYAEARIRYRLDVRPSVRPSHAGTVSKRLNILSCFLHYTIARSFCFVCIKIFAKFHHPLRGR